MWFFVKVLLIPFQVRTFCYWRPFFQIRYEHNNKVSNSNGRASILNFVELWWPNVDKEQRDASYFVKYRQNTGRTWRHQTLPCYEWHCLDIILTLVSKRADLASQLTRNSCGDIQIAPYSPLTDELKWTVNTSITFLMLYFVYKLLKYFLCHFLK